eukprot:TRINITY_DN2886_c0_g2_i1.p1 TRINITY_DN2886_c0_g2~~TRINITY_DN2886_c0_g2_i1.p1  ORF type:complete len:324 (-),score=14.53 TRINITY_DN2886_c0_g2_i1:744-1715(-)
MVFRLVILFALMAVCRSQLKFDASVFSLVLDDNATFLGSYAFNTGLPLWNKTWPFDGGAIRSVISSPDSGYLVYITQDSDNANLMVSRVSPLGEVKPFVEYSFDEFRLISYDPVFRPSKTNSQLYFWGLCSTAGQDCCYALDVLTGDITPVYQSDASWLGLASSPIFFEDSLYFFTRSQPLLPNLAVLNVETSSISYLPLPNLTLFKGDALQLLSTDNDLLLNHCHDSDPVSHDAGIFKFVNLTTKPELVKIGLAVPCNLYVSKRHNNTVLVSLSNNAGQSSIVFDLAGKRVATYPGPDISSSIGWHAAHTFLPATVADQSNF